MKIKQVISETANNIIFSAEKPDGTILALKCVRKPNPTDKEKAVLQHEYGVLSALRGSGVTKVFELGYFDDLFGFSFEYFDGVRLNHLLTYNRFNAKDFLKIAVKIAEALGEIHSKNIIHKDINSSNILGNLKDHSIRIIDFGISSKISLKQPHLGNPEVLEGQLPYISPEQTGRMNRTIDYRSDLYSLGITFYEVLTGELPFAYADPLELVHAHIAKQPVPPCEKNRDVPKVLSDIVLKLTEKNAENRYQSAFILRDDLQKCLDFLEKDGVISDFPIAQNNLSEYLQIPEKLYGREKEIAFLLDSFERISENGVEILTVGGYSGVGKSALVNEVHKSVTEKKGYFVSGKFDQFQRNIPYSALSKALNDFIELMLTESLEKLNARKKNFLEALGENAQVLADLLPNLELIIGKQPPAPQLGAAESQNRFNNVFLSFIRCICAEKVPLVIFIDDLQWADIASLNLIKLIFTDDSVNHLLLIGAYRDNEVYEKHPLHLKIEEMRTENVVINEIKIGNLSEQHLNEMLSDCFQMPPHLTDSLAEVIYEKTLGNAFFARQFLQNLYENEYLSINRSGKSFFWEWDIKKIRALNITDNVVEFISGKILHLNSECQNTLKIASALGDRFSLGELAFICEKTPHEIIRELWQAVAENLILPLDGKFNAVLYNPAAHAEGDSDAFFSFLHDRVQQAAYSLIPKNELADLHYRIAVHLQKSFGETFLNDKIFDIVGHFNQAISELRDFDEKISVAHLNLNAALKAKEANAYQAASDYLNVAEKLLPPDSWENFYRLTCDIYLEQAEVEYLNTNFERTKQIFELVSSRAREKLDLARIYDTMIVLYTNLGEMLEAVKYAKVIIGILDEQISDNPDEVGAKVGEKIGFITEKMAEIGIEQFFNFPEMTNPEKIALMNILVKSVPPAYQTDQTLVGLIITLMVETSVKYGNAPHSSYGYDMFAILAGAALRDFDASFRFGKLAMKLVNHYNATPLKGAVYFVFGNFVSHWGQSLQKSIEIFREGFTWSIEGGDFIHTGYCASRLLVYSFLHGYRLEEIAKETQPYIDFLRQKKDLTCSEMSVLVKRLSLSLINPSETIDNEEFSEAMFENTFEANLFSLSHYYLLKIMHEYWSCRFENAFALLEKAEKVMVGSSGSHVEAAFNFYQSLLYLHFFEQCDSVKKTQVLQKVAENQEIMKVWTKACPVNYEHYFALIEAERFTVENEPFRAIEMYHDAIESATKSGFKLTEILANERLAIFWFKNKKRDYGRKHLQKAYFLTSIWGGNVKKDCFEKDFAADDLFDTSAHHLGTLHKKGTIQGTIHQTQTISAAKSISLDIHSILKAYQTLSEEVQLSRLVEKMLFIVIENAGAQKGVLLENFNDEYYIQAKGNDTNVEKTNKISLLKSINDCPKSVINLVSRSKQFFVCDNASLDERLMKDPYVIEHKTKSVICFPIIKKDEISHIFYLENNLITGAFTENNLQVLKALASQITISLENALLYESLEQKVADRTALLQRALEEVEVKNTNIMHSIRYAQRIQEALLVSLKVLQENFSESFVYYQPRDVVSGDFYWFSRQDEKMFLAAIDCTGHGVPGAFMSLISYNILQSVIHIHGIKNTDEILKHLNEKLITLLRQKETGNTDGMDIALLSIENLPENKLKKVSFSGAKRNFWFLEAESEHLIEVPGDRKSIGGSANENNNFTRHDYVLSSGTSLFLWTDGYTDQSNSKSVRFGTRKLRDLITENAKLPLEELKNILITALKLHQGKAAQRDDILLIGVRL